MTAFWKTVSSRVIAGVLSSGYAPGWCQNKASDHREKQLWHLTLNIKASRAVMWSNVASSRGCDFVLVLHWLPTRQNRCLPDPQMFQASLGLFDSNLNYPNEWVIRQPGWAFLYGSYCGPGMHLGHNNLLSFQKNPGREELPAPSHRWQKWDKELQ